MRAVRRTIAEVSQLREDLVIDGDDETDVSDWDYFELLEETYFTSRKNSGLPVNYIEALENILQSEKEKALIATERDHAVETKA